MNSGFRALALVTALASYLEIVLGGTVRITGSGEACPDWPTCHGQLIPPSDQALSALVEDLHARGLLESTLIVATGEFGRTPKINPGGG